MIGWAFRKEICQGQSDPGYHQTEKACGQKTLSSLAPYGGFVLTALFLFLNFPKNFFRATFPTSVQDFPSYF